ncbi:LTA synthase family protein [Nitrosomonas sp. HPC101]|uniref:LTA synthase family protein n=1 Tax=Nitrosomonas sp. HPC101 TaxID=1658667 RepID=UPI001367DD3A|nr:LTA synthase family protein [Nitrosomonas sp. HPC101]MXS86202.1 LTA synthase family protein [Nitrosomonas sp. HPC101]
MVIEKSFVLVLVASLTGLLLSIIIERLMISRPIFARPWAAWAVHGGLWLLSYSLVTLALGRPWFSVAIVSAFMLMLVLVNNAKVKSLNEPFIFQDYEYFTDAIRHPRLYIPFLGWWKFLGAATGFILAVSIGLWGESVPEQRFTLSGQLGGILILSVLGISFLLAGNYKSLPVSFNPQQDVAALGLLASFWCYGREEKILLNIASPFYFSVPERRTRDLPHLVAIQSESFFDPRSLFSGIRPDVLSEFDRLKKDSLFHGKLKVPAWGANTVRTEFAFLSGIAEDRLGVHRFNPYRAIAAGWNTPSLATFLKSLGYRTICVHPYSASFYRRDRVYPCLGFDEFFDIRIFDNTMRSGPYIGDTAVADKVEAILHNATGPLFIFVITMENHGPLHLEQAAHSDIESLYIEPPPTGCDDLTIYLRHLRNADEMIARLRQTLMKCRQPASLCWFGDHVPIMSTVYNIFGKPGGDVEYICWSNQSKAEFHNFNLSANTLAINWLRELGLISSSKSLFSEKLFESPWPVDAQSPRPTGPKGQSQTCTPTDSVNGAAGDRAGIAY